MNRRLIFLFFSFYLLNLKAQVFSFQDLFFWSKEDIRINKIKTITGYEFDYPLDSNFNDSMIVFGEKQTEERFDTLGRIYSKTNFYPYSDIESKKRTLSYYPNSQVKEYKNFVKNSLERSEKFEWFNNQIRIWHIFIPTPDDMLAFSKETKFDFAGKAVNQLIKKGNKVISEDIVHYIDTDSCQIRVQKTRESKLMTDSLINFFISGDTLLKIEIHDADYLTYKEVHYNEGDYRVKRIEEYEEGFFHKTYYRRIQNGQVLFEKQVHVVPNLNYEKHFIYDENGVPIRKEVFNNNKTPTKVIFYDVEKY